jgi:hypothetical protein
MTCCAGQRPRQLSREWERERVSEMTEAARGVADARDGGKVVGRSHAAYCAALGAIEGGIRFAIPPYGLEFERKMSDQILRAPVDGTVQQLAVHTVGGVVTVSQDAIARDKADSTKSRAALSDTSEPQGQELLYSARISLDRTEMQVEDEVVSVAPGMAVTVEIKTGQRRVIEYLLSLLLRHRHEAIGER